MFDFMHSVNFLFENIFPKDDKIFGGKIILDVRSHSSYFISSDEEGDIAP